MLVIGLSGRKTLKRPQTQANVFILLLDNAFEAPFANMKLERQSWPEMPLILGGLESYVAMVTKLWSTFSRILQQRINKW